MFARKGMQTAQIALEFRQTCRIEVDGFAATADLGQRLADLHRGRLDQASSFAQFGIEGEQAAKLMLGVADLPFHAVAVISGQTFFQSRQAVDQLTRVRQAPMILFQFGQTLRTRVGLDELGQGVVQKIDEIAAVTVVATQIVDLRTQLAPASGEHADALAVLAVLRVLVEQIQLVRAGQQRLVLMLAVDLDQ